MADGKAAAAKTKRSYRRKTPKIAPNPYSGIGVWAFLHFYGGVMTVMDMKTGFSERISGTIFVVSAMPAESAKHTQEEIVKALIAKEAVALQEADIA